jgi:hypothetical protein
MEMEHDPTGVIVNGKELRIPMLHVSGVRKVQKTALGVTISTGLEIETVSAGVSRHSCCWRFRKGNTS